MEAAGDSNRTSTSSRVMELYDEIDERLTEAASVARICSIATSNSSAPPKSDDVVFALQVVIKRISEAASAADSLRREAHGGAQ